MKKGHFFKFVHALQKEEHEKADFFAKLIGSGGASGKPKKNKCKVRPFAASHILMNIYLWKCNYYFNFRIDTKR